MAIHLENQSLTCRVVSADQKIVTKSIDLMEPIVNRVAQSDIQVFNLEELWEGAPVREIDIAPFLMEGLILREKSFREALREFDWEPYRGAHVAVYCSTDAIIPTWAFMLVATRLKDLAASVGPGRAADVIRDHFTRALDEVDWERYRDRNVVVKGCGGKIVPISAYVTATNRLQDVAAKLMFGEPCSSVPLWRKPAQQAPARRAVAAKPVALGKLPPSS